MSDEVFQATFDGDVRSAKETSKDRGEVVAILSVSGVEYEMGYKLKHVIAAGAFENQRVPVFHQHAWIDGRAPIGHGDVMPAGRQLRARVQLYLDVESARAVFHSLKAKAMRQWSIGYRILDSTVAERDGWTIVTITKADLLEASSVLRGAHPETDTLKVAAASAPAATAPDLDEIAKRAGLKPDHGDLDLGSTSRERVASAFARATPRKIITATSTRTPVQAMAADLCKRVASAGGEPVTVGMNARETADFFTAAAAPTSGDRGLVGPALPPSPSILSLVPIVPWSGSGKRISVSDPGDADEVPYGTAATLLTVSIAGDEFAPRRVAAAVKVPTSVLTDAGVGVEAVEGILRGAYLRGLSDAVVNGDGTGDNLLGLRFTPGLPQQSATGLTVAATFARAQEKVWEAGYTDGRTTVLAQAGMLAKNQAELRNLCPLIDAFLPTVFLFPTRAIVGVLDRATTLYLDALTITASNADDDNFRKGLTSLLIETRASLWTHHPDALTEVLNVVTS